MGWAAAPMQLLLLLLLGAALQPNAEVEGAAACPIGYLPIKKAADKHLATQAGKHAFQWHMRESCSQMPVFVTQPLQFGMRLTPRCTNPKRSLFTLDLSYKNPCAGNKRQSYTLTVNWQPSKCSPDYWPVNVTGQIVQDVDQMRELPCPRGMKQAPEEVVGNVLDAVFLEQLVPDLRGGKYFCRGGMATVQYSNLQGCIVSQAGGALPSIMAQGQASYTCYKSSAVLRIGFKASGTYQRQCLDRVTVKPLAP